MPTTPQPLALTDDQLASIMRAAFPLLPTNRTKFLEEVARELAALPEIGDGALHRILMMVQHRHWTPPVESGNHAGPKHRGSKYG